MSSLSQWRPRAIEATRSARFSVRIGRAVSVARIVVTDDEGRYLIPDLPAANAEPRQLHYKIERASPGVASVSPAQHPAQLVRAESLRFSSQFHAVRCIGTARLKVPFATPCV